MLNYVYIVRCADGTLYTGWTNNLDERIKTHNDGAGAKYTRSRLPVDLVYQETFDDKRLALKREFEIKKLTRTQKEILISSPNGSAFTSI
jgi:putative endonuclease